MGWTSSPPFFCTATRTVTDLTNATLNQSQAWPPHCFKKAADPLPTDGTQIATHAVPSPEWATVAAQAAWCNAFVDDHVALAQGTLGHLQQTRCTLMHSINCVFRPLVAPLNWPTRQEPISCKKLAMGDGQWSMQKTIISWCLDMAQMTLTLLPHWAARLHKLLDSIPCHCMRIATKCWHQLLGELWSMVLALLGSHGLFSTLQDTLQQWETSHQLCLGAATHDFLDNFWWLAHDLTS